MVSSKEGRVYLVHSSRIQSIRKEKSWLEEVEAESQIASTVRKQREMDSVSHLSLTFSFIPGIQSMELCYSLLGWVTLILPQLY